MKKNKFYISTPIYYVNDKPHIGHAYTTVAADVLARYHRLAGDEVFFLTGTDEHGSKVAESAVKAGLTPQEFCDRNAAKFQALLPRLDISHDEFIRTTAKKHQRGVSRFLTKLKKAGAIYQGEYRGLYCVECEKFITEKELVDGQCPDHRKVPQTLVEKNYFFNLKKYLPPLEKLLKQGKVKVVPASRHQEVLGLIRQDLEDFSISRENVKWGIKLPFDENQVTYVWVDALLNYITALGYGEENSEKLKRFWPADVHLIGKDIIKFHAIYWPAMLLAAGELPPKIIFAHGFFTIDGQKMSKTIGNVIDPNFLVDQYGSDAARYLLLSQFPFGQDGDVKAESFTVQYNADLANGVGNLVSRVLAMAEKYFQGQVPESNQKDSPLADRAKAVWRQYQNSMNELAVDKTIVAVKSLLAAGDGYIEENQPWVLAKKQDPKLAGVIYDLLELIRHLGFLLAPIMPRTADLILISLGQADWQNQPLAESQKWGGLKSGQKIKKGESLFPRLESKDKK